MSTAKRIVKNTTILFIATIVGYILGFFTTVYTAQYLGAEGFGVISLALSLTAIFGVITDLGLNTLIVREVARNKSLADKYVSNTILMKTLLSFLTIGLLILTVKLIGYTTPVSNIIYIIIFSIIFVAFSGIFNAIFQSYEKMEYQSVGTILNAVLMFVGVLIAIYFNLNILAFAFIYFIASLVVLVYSILIYSWKFALPKISVDWSFWSPTIKESLPFAITGIFTMVYYWIDSVMLSVMIGNEVVGWYNAAYRLILIITTLYSVYMISIFPVMSGFYKTSHESIKIAYERSVKYMLIMNIPLAIITTLLANKIILLIYGTGYIPAVIALQILIWSVVFMFINTLSLNLLGSVNKQFVVAKIAAFGAISNIILNLLLIPEFSYIGSSAATVATELLMLPIFLYVLRKTEYVDASFLIKDLFKILISNIVLIIIIILLNQLNLFLILLIGVVLYLFMIYITNTLDKEDISLIKSLIKRK